METTNDQPFIVADSSGLFSLSSASDANHARAAAAAEGLVNPQTTILVPYDVYAETVNLLGKKAGHAAAVAVARLLRSGPPFAVTDSSGAARVRAIERFAALPRSVSYTDCVVMAVADEYATRRIFGFDAAFARAGYQILAKEGAAAA